MNDSIIKTYDTDGIPTVEIFGYIIPDDYHVDIANDTTIPGATEWNHFYSLLEEFVFEYDEKYPDILKYEWECDTPDDPEFNDTQHMQISNVNIMLYIADNKSDIDLMISNITHGYNEDLLEYRCHNIGYSEFTILDFIVDESKLGGHNLEDILRSYSGKYMHMIMLCGGNR